MSEVVALLGMIVTVLLYMLGVLAFMAGLGLVGIITRHWVAR